MTITYLNISMIYRVQPICPFPLFLSQLMQRERNNIKQQANLEENGTTIAELDSCDGDDVMNSLVSHLWW